MLRVGLVGCGFIGRAHSWALAALRKADLVDARVVAVCDADAERATAMAKPHDADVVALDPLLEQVDVVYVCTPTVTHPAIVEAAAGRGAAIYCEKPLAVDLAGAERVGSALERVPHQVGLVLRYSPVMRALGAEIASGRHGRLMALTLRDDQYLPDQGIYASSWRTDASVAGGGTLIEHSIHDVDVFRWFAGDPSSVACRTASFFGHDGIEDSAVATLAYPSGSTSMLVSVWHQVLSRTSTRRIEAFCESAILWTDNDQRGPLHVETSHGADAVDCAPASWIEELPVPDVVRGPLAPYVEASRAFLDAVANGRTPSPNAGDALAAHRVVDAAYRSAASDGLPVAL